MTTRIAIFGLGVMGGSIAKALRAHDHSIYISAYDIQHTALEKAQKDKTIDDFFTSLHADLSTIDIIIIATPLTAYETIFNAINHSAKNTALILDIGSVKSAVVTLAEQTIPEHIANFVPGHPIAGSEQSGFNAATATLLENKLVVLTPTQYTALNAIKTAETFWQQLGTRTTILSAEDHDSLLACTSHLPQLLSYAFMHFIAESKHYPDILNFTGSGFRDFTRLASSNPQLWQSIMLANRDNLLKDIEQFTQQLQTLKTLLTKQDVKKLTDFFSIAQAAHLDYEKL